MGRKTSVPLTQLRLHLQWVPCWRYLTAFLYIRRVLYTQRQRVIKASLDSCYRKRASIPFDDPSATEAGRPITEMFVMTPLHAERKIKLFLWKENSTLSDSSLIDFDTFLLRHPFYFLIHGKKKKKKFRSCSLLELVGGNKIRMGGGSWYTVKGVRWKDDAHIRVGRINTRDVVVYTAS